MHEQLKEALRKAGYSLTKTRLTVFGALQGVKPKTMHELVAALEGIVDRSSVYRSVNLFEDLGIVNRIQHGWKYRIELSDDFTPHHHHLTCQNCQRVISFDEPTGLETMLEGIALEHHFVPRSHHLEIYGLCPQCTSVIGS